MHNKKNSHEPHKGNGEKKEFKQTWGKLIEYGKKYIPAIILAFVLSIIGTIITVISPDRVSEITDLITQGLVTGINIEKITQIATLLLVLYVISFIFSYLQGFIMSTVTQNLTQKLRSDISQKINRLPLKYFDKITFGDVLSRVTNDVDTIGQTLNQSITSLVSGITLF